MNNWRLSNQIYYKAIKKIGSKKAWKIRSVFKTVLWILSIAIVFLPLDINTFEVAKKEVVVVFRYDDYSTFSPTELEKKLIDLFRKRRVSCIFGVIPYACPKPHDPSPQELVPLSDEKARIIHQAQKEGVIQIAQHGFSHQTSSISIKKGYSEFKDLSYNIQLAKIIDGKNLLEKKLALTITLFIPPWNSYDLNTIKALEASSFELLSAGMLGSIPVKSKIKQLPATCGLSEFKDFILKSKLRNFEGPIVVLFHAYDFIESGDRRGKVSIEEMGMLLDWLIVQESIRVWSSGQELPVLSEASLKLIGHLAILNRLRIYLGSSIVPKFIYFPSAREVRKTMIIGIIYFLLLYGCMTIVSWKIGQKVVRLVILRKMKTFFGFLFCLSFSIAGFLVGYGFYNPAISLRRMIATVCFIGMSLGMVIGWKGVSREGVVKRSLKNVFFRKRKDEIASINKLFPEIMLSIGLRKLLGSSKELVKQKKKV